MRKAAAILIVLLFSGCSAVKSDIDRGMELRTKLLKAESFSFDTVVTADYGDEIYSFTMNCTADSTGKLDFTVTEPTGIAGISGTIDKDSGMLTFDDVMLAFPLLADGQLSPVSAPWIFTKTLLSGYLTAAGEDGEYLRLSIDDSYRDDALHLDIWLDERDLPVRAEILHKTHKILSLDVKNFTIA